MRKKLSNIRFTLFSIWIIPSIISAQEAGDAAKTAQNPLANVISMPFQNNTDFGIGAYDKTSNVLNIQPILPVHTEQKRMASY